MITQRLREIIVDMWASAAPDRIALNTAGGEWKFYLFDALLSNMNCLNMRSNISIFECIWLWWLRRSKPRDLLLSAVNSPVTRDFLLHSLSYFFLAWRVWWSEKAVYLKSLHCKVFCCCFWCYFVSKNKPWSFLEEKQKLSSICTNTEESLAI